MKMHNMYNFEQHVIVCNCIQSIVISYLITARAVLRLEVISMSCSYYAFAIVDLLRCSHSLPAIKQPSNTRAFTHVIRAIELH